MKLLPLLLLATLTIAARAAEQLELRPGDVVAFVGGTDMVRAQKSGRLEAALTQRHRDARPKFRDLAWDGDTVYFQGTVGERWRREAFGGWREQLQRVGATVVIAQFGKIESLDGPARLDAFREAYGKLLDELAAGGRRVFLLAPGPFEWPQADASALADYTRAVKTLAEARGLTLLEGDAGVAAGGEPPPALVAAVREKHRLWSDYWRPANWKCLFGDDSKRVFSNATAGLPSFKQEWETFPPLIAAAEARIFNGEAPAPLPPPARSGVADADTAKELAAFKVLDGFEVSLFADERQGIANPLSVRWDADGRMFVACSDTYPQIEPGVKPNDRIYKLTDRDGDGRADASEVFAEGLNIPTGMEVGHDGVYVGQGTEILFLDWKGGRKILLSGFGNGDSHQTINSFVWSPGGELWFGQGDGVESRVETPSGVSSLFQAGVFRLRPGQLQLDAFLDDFMGPGNPWGVAFDDFGQSFVIDGAGGVFHLTPASVPVRRRLRLPQIGKPGGYCGIECLGAGTLPAAMQGEFLVGDYKKNQVSRFAAVDDGAGFKVEWREPLLRSSHRNFRPVDVKLGPDGAIYVVDWYNPITCHQDDFYRHPTRDKTHGRIWRVARKGATQPAPALRTATDAALFEALRSPERWTRQKAKETLAARGLKTVPAVFKDWAGRDLLEAVAALEWLDVPDRPLVQRLMQSTDHRARAYAARVVGRWGTRLENPFGLLQVAAADPHPRVRMEALLACAALPDPRSVLIAAAVAERPRDRWIDYAFAQTVQHLKPHWLPALRRGELDFGAQARGFAAVLGAADAKVLVVEIRKLLAPNTTSGEARLALTKALLAIGDDTDVRAALETTPPNAAVLRALALRERPGFDVAAPLRAAAGAPDPEARLAALDLAGRWRVKELHDVALTAAARADGNKSERQAAVRVLGIAGGAPATELLQSIARKSTDPAQAAALAALLEIEPPSAAQAAAAELRSTKSPELLQEVLHSFAARAGGAALLAAELAKPPAIERPQGERLRAVWIQTGLVDAELTRALDGLAGVAATNLEFSDALLKKIVASAATGNPAKGEAIFRSETASCAACHRIGDRGGLIGPDLTGIGNTAPPERIATEVLWPTLQVKEGYAMTLVTLDDKQVLAGYPQPGRDKAVLLLRNSVTGEISEIPRKKIVSEQTTGSLMPPIAQSLPPRDLADLLAYLFQLGVGAGK